MIKVYVDSMPKTAEECPFYKSSESKCNITNDKCCLSQNKTDCEHLATLFVVEESTDEIE